MRAFLLSLCAVAFAQDPAQGWLGYAAATSPTGSGRLTYAEAYWTNGGIPAAGGAFYSPWFGIEASDNLNLFQPVNPWLGSSWSIYNEYFQWVPENNINSNDHQTQPGDLLYGNVTFDASTQSYTAVHVDLTDGWSVTTTIPVQQDSNGQYKNYTILYVVFEKPANCDQYPPEGVVTFSNIRVEYDGKRVTPSWKTGIVDDVCNNRAAVLNSTTVQITWDTAAENPAPELIAARQLVGMQRPRRSA